MSVKTVFAIIFSILFAICPVSLRAQALTIDPDFTPAVTGGGIRALAIQPDQKILVGGLFTNINGTVRLRIARINPDGNLDTTFNANAIPTNNGVFSIQVMPDGKLLVTGSFGMVDALNIKRILRLNSDGSMDTGLTTIPYFTVSDDNYIARQLPDGKILMCGTFGSSNGSGPGRLARFNNDGSLDTTFTHTINWGPSGCHDLDLADDGKALVAGDFTTIDGSAHSNLARFNTDGSLDSGFVTTPIPGSTITRVLSAFIAPDDRIYYHTSAFFAPSTTRSYLRRMNPDGSNIIDKQIEPADVYAAAFPSGGKSLFAAKFGTPSAFKLARFFPNGSPDPSLGSISFNSGFTDPFFDMAIQSDGNIIVTGFYGDVNGTPRLHITRFISEDIPVPPQFDFDGDGKTDISVFRPSDQYWYTTLSSNGSFSFNRWGLGTDKPVAADYDGDGMTDIAVYRDTAWYVIRSTDSTYEFRTFGQAGDVPLTADINHDGTLDMILRRNTGGTVTWRVAFDTGNNQTSYPAVGDEGPSDIPVIGDFDGDLKSEYGFFRNGDWYLENAFFGIPVSFFHWGMAGDIPVAGDYDGDLRTDYAVFRPSEGNWYVMKSQEGFYAFHWGLAGDIPVPGDYDGDGQTDIAVFRPSEGNWYVMKSQDGFYAYHWGATGDVPIPSQTIYQSGFPKAPLSTAPSRKR